MKLMKTMFSLAVGSVSILGGMSAHAFTLNNGDRLTINSGAVNAYVQSVTGSFFVMDFNGDSKAQYSEIVTLSQGTTGITIGALGGAGNTHVGTPVPADADSGEIVDSWLFNGSTGTNYVAGTPITGSTGLNGVDMSGWMVNWSSVLGTPMTTGAWDLLAANPIGGWSGSISGTTNGMANFSWSGVYGGAYTLDYTATVPVGDASGFGGTQYALHLEGCVPVLTPGPGDCGYVSVTPTIPEASTYAMMLAGLGLVGFVTDRRKQKQAAC